MIVNITTTDGRTFTKQLDYPKGDPRNPLTDAEIEEKFAALAEGVLSEGAQKKLKNAIWNLEKVGSVSKLMALMKADVRRKAVSRKAVTRARNGDSARANFEAERHSPRLVTAEDSARSEDSDSLPIEPTI